MILFSGPGPASALGQDGLLLAPWRIAPYGGPPPWPRNRPAIRRAIPGRHNFYIGKYERNLPTGIRTLPTAVPQIRYFEIPRNR